VIAQAIFYFFAALTVASAVLMIAQKNPMHSVLYLAFAILSISGVFFAVQADFLGAVQIIVYAGGIVVLYIFVIIIINLNEVLAEKRALFPKLFIIAVPVLLTLEIAVTFFSRGVAFPGPSEGSLSLEALARRLMSTYVIPFEIASILLLAVLIGAIYIARKRVGDDTN
jgi:NADH-quinone oxidoreductase subunit J